MRITVSHNRPKEEVVKSVDRSLDDLFRSVGSLPLQFTNEKRSWHGSVLTFSMSAKMGFLSAPIAGTVDVTDRDVTIDVDLGILERLLTSAKAKDAIATKVRGLLT